MPVRIKKLCYPTLGLLLWLALQAGAHVGDRLYPIPYLSDEMLAEIQLDDGQIQEWYDLLGEPTLNLLDFTEEFQNSPLDPSDLDFRIWLAWHDEPARLYVAFVASDDVYKNTHDYDSSNVNRQYVHMNDSITLAIDGDHSGGAGNSNSDPMERWIEVHGQTQFYAAISHTASGPTLSDLMYRVQTGHAFMDDPATLCGKRGRRRRRSPGHLGGRAVRDAVRPLGRRILARPCGERSQPVFRGRGYRFHDSSE